MSSTEDQGFMDHDPADPFTGEIPDSLKSLLGRLDIQAEGWKPKPGDTAFGTLVDMADGESEYGVYPLLTLEAPGGQYVNVHCFHTVLKREVERRQARGTIKIGDQVAVRYLGQIGASQKGSPSHMYRLAVDPKD